MAKEPDRQISAHTIRDIVSKIILEQLADIGLTPADIKLTTIQNGL